MAVGSSAAITAVVLSVLGGAGFWRQASTRSDGPEEGAAPRLNRLADEFIALYDEGTATESAAMIPASLSDGSSIVSIQEASKLLVEMHSWMQDVDALVFEEPAEEVVVAAPRYASVVDGARAHAVMGTSAAFFDAFAGTFSVAAGKFQSAVDISSLSTVLFLVSLFVAGCFCHRRVCASVRGQTPSHASCRLVRGANDPAPVLLPFLPKVTNAPMLQCAGDIDVVTPEPDADKEVQARADPSVSESLEQKASAKCESFANHVAMSHIASPMRRRRSAGFGAE